MGLRAPLRTLLQCPVHALQQAQRSMARHSQSCKAEQHTQPLTAHLSGTTPTMRQPPRWMCGACWRSAPRP